MSSVSSADMETEKRLKAMEKHLREIYDQATKDVGKAWTEFMEKANADVSRLTEAYIKAKESGDQTAIREAGKALAGAKQERTIYNNHYQQLTRDLAENISHVNETAMAYINNQLPEIYSLNYNSVANGVNKQLGGMVGGTSFNLTDQNTVKRLATRQENLLPLKEVNGKKDIRWNVAKINSEVTQGILQGEAMPKIAERLSNVLGMDKVSAIRNARTTVTSAQNKGRMDMMRHARSKGVIVQKGWSSALDDRTRESHIELDGEFVDEDEPFSNGLMFPGDPNGKPEEVYNCRCSLVYKVVGFGDPQEEEDDPWEGFEDEQTEEQTEQQQEATRYESNVLRASLGQDFDDFSQLVTDAPTRGLYEKYAESATIRQTPNGGVYRSGSNTVEYGLENREGQNKFSTLAHECGHMFDNNIGRDSGLEFSEIDKVNGASPWGRLVKQTPSQCDQFLKAMRSDMDTLKPMLKDGTLKSEFLSNAFMRNSTAGVQDALDGFFGTQNSSGLTYLPWGHGNAYYNRMYNHRIKGQGDVGKKLKDVYKSMGFDASNQTKVMNITRHYEASSELWANVSSAVTCGGPELDAMNKYMPNSVKAYLEIIKAVGGAP